LFSLSLSLSLTICASSFFSLIVLNQTYYSSYFKVKKVLWRFSYCFPFKNETNDYGCLNREDKQNQLLPEHVGAVFDLLFTDNSGTG
jgi:hypothetical protein